jgi:hypothetical protein
MGVHQEAELQAGEEVGRRWLITPSVALSGEVEVVESRAFVRLAAIVVAVGLTSLAAALSLIVAIKGTDTVNTSSAELEDPGSGARSRS